MTRIQLDIPEPLKRQAEDEARRRGMTLDAVIRAALQAMLTKPDPLFDDDYRYSGPAPRDLSSNLDKYLYGDEGDALH